MYLWIQALHVIAVISWMAGLLYLPRLYVYHVEAIEKKEPTATFKVMEEKLLRFIMTPAMIITWIAGLALVGLNPTIGSEPWFWVKFVCVLLMSGFQGACSKWRKSLKDDPTHFTSRQFRLKNEIPTVLMIVIIVMVIVRPF